MRKASEGIKNPVTRIRHEGVLSISGSLRLSFAASSTGGINILAFQKNLPGFE
jgi:hypothetical protein